MDPKEYRRIFRRAQSCMRDMVQAVSQLTESATPASKLLEDFELAYEAECDSTEALQREVTVLSEKVEKLKARLNLIFGRAGEVDNSVKNLHVLFKAVDEVEALVNDGANALDLSKVFEARKAFL